MATLAPLPAIPAQGTHRPVMERAAEIFLTAFPGLTPAELLAGSPSPLLPELASALAAVRARAALRVLPGGAA